LVLPPVNDEKLVAATLERANGWLLSGLQEEGRGEGEALMYFGLKHAMQKGLPILACGSACALLASFWGMATERRVPQVLFGHRQPLPKSQPFHPVALKKGSWLEACLGLGQLVVNSMHRPERWFGNEQADIAATALDGTTEAIEGRNGKAVGLRWNPEFLLDSVPCQTLLFRHFILLARQYRR
jgi:putative glutamine amidotransferase